MRPSRQAPRRSARPHVSAPAVAHAVAIAIALLLPPVLGAQEPVAATDSARARPLQPDTLATSPTATAAARGDQRDTLANTTLTVQNRNYQDVVVWLERQGTRTRLGNVNSASTRRFVIPRRFLVFADEFRFVAEAIGRRDATTGARTLRAASPPLFVGPGQRLTWTLESGLERSFIGVSP